MLIKYVGLKPSRADTVAGTGLVWTSGQVHSVAESVAPKLLRHADIWQKVSGEDHGEPTGSVGRPEEEYTELPQPLINTERMSKEELAHFAFTKYGHKLDQRRTRESLIKEVDVLIERNSIVAKLSDAE